MKRLLKPSASGFVLFLLCLMYLITYIDRVNIATAAEPIRKEFHLSDTKLGLAFSAFGYAYLLLQVFGGWIARGSFIALGGLSLIWVAVWAFYFRDDPRHHSRVVQDELATLPAYRGGMTHRPRTPWRPLTLRMIPVIVVYFCYGWTLWLY